MTWLLPILRHRVTWGVGIAVGVLAAIAAHGALKYRDGFAAGRAERDAQAQTDALIASRAADSTRAVLLASLSAATARADSLRRVSTRKAARAEVAQIEAVQAIATYRADTASQTPVASTLANACEAALAAAQRARKAAEEAMAADRAVITTLQETVATEPQRTDAAVTQALATQRHTFRTPSRLTWATLGAAVATIITLGVTR